MTNTIRKVSLVTQGMAASDGAGVQLTRIIGVPGLQELDPFLMLDMFESNNPNDYIGGFPPHPHRGFETVTYLLAGKMRHEDNQGHKGVIEPGGVQWMTAGKGIVHSEMPEQTNGLLKGFQLWVNLPASKKMTEPAYQEFPAHEIGIENRENIQIKVIAGETATGTKGPVKNAFITPLMMDITLQNDAQFFELVPSTDHTFIYVINGAVNVQSGESNHTVKHNHLAVLSDGDAIAFQAIADNTEVLMLSASPINEPIARGGPFVMNTPQEIEQAFSDYKNGRF